MPDIFKALATVTAWVFWICGFVMGFSTLIMGIVRGDLYSTEVTTPMEYPVGFAVALAYGIGAVVVMLLRKKMEK